MVSLPRYDCYKDSGVEWLGEIPEHWNLLKNKFLFQEQKETVGKKSSSFTLLSLTLNGVIKRDMENPQGKFPAEFNTYKIVEPNNLIFCLFDVEETPRTVGHSEFKGMITGAYDLFKCHSNVYSKYIYYYYLSLDFDKRLQPLYTGLRKVIKRDSFLGMKSPVPPIAEQKRIAEFLDRKCGEIEEAIRKKQRLIELLEEQKTILINQAVTKGLNPNAPMKDSGIEWLGAIPKHWEISKIGHYARVSNGSTPSRDRLDYWKNGNIHWLSSGKVNDIIITESSELITVKALKECSIRLYPKGSVVIGLVGQGKTRGTTSILDIETCINQNMAAIEVNKNLDGIFLLKFLSQAYQVIRNFGKGGNQEALNCELVRSFKIVVPPIQEQNSIVQNIDNIENKSLQIYKLLSKQIEKLTELKQILIAEAVTGKIKI